MDKFPEIPTIEEFKKSAAELKSKVPQSAQEYFDQMTGKIANTQMVSDLVADVKENPAKVGCEAGLSALAGAAVFAGMRFYDSYVASKKNAGTKEAPKVADAADCFAPASLGGVTPAVMPAAVADDSKEMPF